MSHLEKSKVRHSNQLVVVVNIIIWPLSGVTNGFAESVVGAFWKVLVSHRGRANDGLLVLIVLAEHNRERFGYRKHRNYVRSISTLLRVVIIDYLVLGCF
jgi:hypothetical protein